MLSVDGKENRTDLRRVGTHPDFWYPLAWSDELKAGRPRAVSFAGEPIVLVRTKGGSVFALEDRCMHRQIPLSEGEVCGEYLKCGYHAWTYDRTGRCVNIPYLDKSQHPGRGVRGYPCREAFGLVFVFPGDTRKAASAPFPSAPAAGDPGYRTRRLSRLIRCHYTFMHENLMDMNHQFLHRRFMGGIRPALLEANEGEDWVEAVYTFSRVSGRQSLGEKFMLVHRPDAPRRREHDLMTIRTQYPYQTLTFTRADGDKPALDLWLAYVPTDRGQKSNHSFGLMSVRKPPVPGLMHLFWPFICWFTENIFAQDRRIVELEQAAHDAQGADWNREVFPVIRSLRGLLARKGVPPGGPEAPGLRKENGSPAARTA